MGNPTFFNRPPTNWNILDYLNQHDPTSPSYDHQATIDRWTKALAAIAKGVDKYTPEQRDKAHLLLDHYKYAGRSSDRNRAREWLSSHQANKKRKLKSGASVTIFQAPVNQGTFNNATFNQNGGGGGQASRATSVGRSVGSETGLHEQVYQAEIVYQAPVNQGTFNDSTFNQVGHKRGLPDDSEESRSLDDDLDPNDEVPEPDTSSSINTDQNPESVPSATPQPKRDTDDFTSIYNRFITTYKTIPAESKFIFSNSHRVLEDVIFENASALTTKSSAHLWVVDFDDVVVTSWFQPKELEELRSLILPLPETDKVFLSSMARFSYADTADEFRRVAEKVPYRPEEESYDRSKHFDAAWVNTVILSMLSILESPNNLLLHSSLREGWFDCNPWSFLIDQCLLGLNGVLVQRKEIICLALKLVENACTETPGKGNHGRRFDGIIHTLGDSPVIEYGAIEVAKSFESVHTKKWVNDSTKLVHALQAMLSRLHKLVNHDEDTIKKLQVVGLLNAGLNLQVIRMNGVNKNVFLLERGKIRSVPTTLESLKSIFTVMISISVFKQMIQDCVAIVKGYSGLASGNPRQTQQELLEELMKQNDL